MSEPTISVVIKAKNEAHQIVDCVASLQGFATEILVVNDRSTDDTAEIATRLGARVIQAESRDGLIDELDKIGFEAACGEWLLRVDADERMTPGLADALLQVARSGRYAGVRFARKHIMFGEWVRHGGWFQSDQLRFFRADAWDHAWDYEILHSHPPVAGKILSLPAKEHLATLCLAYDDVAQFVHRTLWRYALVEARVDLARGRRFSPWRLLSKPVRRLLGRLIVRQGFRDGWRGLVIAVFLAAYDFCIEANKWDLERKGKTRASGGS